MGYGNSWSDQRLSRWLPLRANELYYMELWADYLTPDGRVHVAGAVSAAVRLATVDSEGRSVEIPIEVSALGQLESGADGCMQSSRDDNECYTAGTAGYGLMSGQEGWRFYDTVHAERGLDWMFRPNYVFDPIPSLFLRHGGPTADVETFEPGGRGALRQWWGWAEGESTNPATNALYLDEAWLFPWAADLGAGVPTLLNASLPPNGTEMISEIATERTPFKGVYATYAEVITTFFRPKRSARYAFKLWSDDNLHARLYFNALGQQASGAVEIAASRSTRFADRDQPSDHYNDNCQACAARARSDFFELQEGSLYFLRVYHAASNSQRTGKSPMRLGLVMAPPLASALANGTGWERPVAPALYDKLTPCEVAQVDPRPRRRDDSRRMEGEHPIDLIDDSWLVMPHDQAQVVLRVGRQVARCAAAGDDCAVPPATTAAAPSRRRRNRALLQPQEEDDNESSKDLDDDDDKELGAAGGGRVLLPLSAATADVEDEDDDHIRSHAEVETLPELDGMLARAPLHRRIALLRELRQDSVMEEEAAGIAASEAAGRGVVGGRRRLSALPLPVLRWSDPATWGGLPPPSANGNGSLGVNGTDIMYIPNNTHILLDVSVYIRVWVIEGILTLADEADIELEAEAIIVHHGELRVGSLDAPFAHRATLTLHGHWATPQLPTFGIKLIGLTQGKLFMHGQPKTPFLRLGASALAGSTTIQLESVPEGWQAGDELVVISGKHDVNCTMLRDDACETEEVVLSQIDGATLTLDAPLLYSHQVQTVAADGRVVTLAPEVINLNRNVRVRGSSGPGTAGFGGHVMLLQPTDGESMLHHVEFYRMGQAMRVVITGAPIHTLR